MCPGGRKKNMNPLYDIIFPFIEFNFLRNSLFAILALATSCAPIGVFLQLRGMTLVGDAMGHALLPGVAIGILLGGASGLSMYIGGLTAGLLVAALAWLINRKTKLKEDSSFTSFYLISLALGILIISKIQGPLGTTHILFGNLLSVTDNEIWALLTTTVITLLGIVLIYRPLMVECFDPMFLKSMGINGSLIHGIFLFLMVLNLVAGFKSMGTLMVIGLMMIPATTARYWVSDLLKIILLSMFLAIFSGVVGLLISYRFDMPPAPAIILLAGMTYLFSVVFGSYNGMLKTYLINKRGHFEK
jgi:zinc/manganese transport system permease protein